MNSHNNQANSSLWSIVYRLRTIDYRLWTILLIAITFSSCKIYSFTGASVSPDLKTIAVENFVNKSQNGNTFITQDLTDKLKNRFVNETPLKITTVDPDLEMKGALINYAVSSQAATGGVGLAALNRLTLTVKVEFINNKDDKLNWDENFTRFADYPSTSNLLQVERELVEDINRQISDDIFNRAFVNW
jgi:hypothetical protein